MRRNSSTRFATASRRCRSSHGRGQRERARARPGADRQRLRRDRHLRARPAPAARFRISTSHVPHHVPLSFEGRRRNVTLTLCGDRRGRRPMHVVAVGGRDEEARERLDAADSRCDPRSAARRAGATSRASADFGRAIATVDRIRTAIPVSRCRPGRATRAASRSRSRRRRRSGRGWRCSPSDGDVRRRRVRRSACRSTGRSTTSTSRTRTTSSPVGSSPTTRSTASAARTSGTSSSSRTITRTRTS